MLMAVLAFAASGYGGAPADRFVPVQRDQQACALSSKWGTGQPLAGRHSNFVQFSEGKPTWNGEPIDEATLRDYVKRAKAIVPRPTLTLFGRGAGCDELIRIATLIEAAGDCKPVICVVSFRDPPARDPVPPPPPLPPKLARSVLERSVVAQEPLRWITRDDYPPAALRAGQQGTTSVTLRVDDKGLPTGCRVKGSTASALLDQTTCTLLMARARFTPALDAEGRPTSSEYESRYRWEIPPRERFPLASWVREIRFTIGSEGEILSCGEQAYGEAWVSPKTGCERTRARPRKMLKDVRGTATGPVTITMRQLHTLAGSPLPVAPALPAAFKAVLGSRVRFVITPEGNAENCVANYGRGAVMLSAAACDRIGHYGRGSTRQPVTTVATFYTDGDPRVLKAATALAKSVDWP
jgi:TonB family protein